MTLQHINLGDSTKYLIFFALHDLNRGLCPYAAEVRISAVLALLKIVTDARRFGLRLEIFAKLTAWELKGRAVAIPIMNRTPV